MAHLAEPEDELTGARRKSLARAIAEGLKTDLRTGDVPDIDDVDEWRATGHMAQQIVRLSVPTMEPSERPTSEAIDQTCPCS
jgi:hypothetical protein